MGLETITYRVPQVWNLVPTVIKNDPSLSIFKEKIKSWHRDNCPCSLCKTFVCRNSSCRHPVLFSWWGKNTSGLGKATASKVIRRVTFVISEKRGPKYIVLPKTKEEVEKHAWNFYNWYIFPQCIGAVDGTHIKVKRL